MEDNLTEQEIDELSEYSIYVHSHDVQEMIDATRIEYGNDLEEDEKRMRLLIFGKEEITHLDRLALNKNILMKKNKNIYAATSPGNREYRLEHGA